MENQHVPFPSSPRGELPNELKKAAAQNKSIKSVVILCANVCQLLEQHNQFDMLINLREVIEEFEKKLEEIASNTDSLFADKFCPLILFYLQQLYDDINRFTDGNHQILFREEVMIEKIARHETGIEALKQQIDQWISQRKTIFINFCHDENAAKFWVSKFGEDCFLVDWDSYLHKFEEEYGKIKKQTDLLKMKFVLCGNDTSSTVSLLHFIEAVNNLVDEETSTNGFPDFLLSMTSQRGTIYSSTTKKKYMLTAGSSYRGIVLQPKCPDVSIFLKIDERSEKNFKGTILWCIKEYEDAETSIQGSIDENQSTISWTEQAILKGHPMLPIPSLFEGKYNIFIGTISGTWKANDQKGNFELEFQKKKKQPKKLEMSGNHNANPEERKSTGIIHKGFLTKQGGAFRSWQYRLFVLEAGEFGTALTYYKNHEEFPQKPKGRIDLATITKVQPRRDIAHRKHLFEVVTLSRTFILQPETKEEGEKWMRVIADEIKQCLDLTAESKAEDPPS